MIGLAVQWPSNLLPIERLLDYSKCHCETQFLEEQCKFERRGKFQQFDFSVKEFTAIE